MDAEPRRTLTNLWFADDVVLVAQSEADMSQMLIHLAELASQHNLKLNLVKKKAMARNHLRKGCISISVGESSVQILDEALVPEAVLQWRSPG